MTLNCLSRSWLIVVAGGGGGARLHAQASGLAMQDPWQLSQVEERVNLLLQDLVRGGSQLYSCCGFTLTHRLF